MKNTKSKFLQLNNFFDKGLYQEGMRQIKTFGIISTVLSAVFATLVPLYMFFIIVYTNTMSYTFDRDSILGVVEGLKESKDIIAANHLYFGYLTVILLIFVPVTCFMLFSFLTKRKSCDYFHSFPQKRGCIYTSYLLAVCTWIFFIISGFTVCSLIIYLGFSYFFDVSLLYILQYSLYTLVAAILGAITICMACSMTGTIFTNVIISGILLFLPRIFITAISLFLSTTSGIFVPNHLTLWSELDTNLIFAFITRAFTDLIGMFDGSIRLPSFISFVYTLVIAFVYYWLGRFFFVRRNSESAGRPADSRLTRFIFRISTGMPYALLSIILVLSNIYFSDDGKVEPVIFFFVVVLEIMGIATIFIYEMISTKSFNVLLRVLPAIPAYLILQVCIVFISSGIQLYELSFKPAPEDIDYIVLENLEEEEFFSFENDNYFFSKLSNRKYYSDETLKLVSDELISDINSEAVEDDEAYCVTVLINSGFLNKYRNLNLTESQYDQFLNSLFNDSAFADEYLTIPEFDEDNIYIYDDALYEYDGTKYDYSGYETVYNAMRRELKTIDPGRFTSLINDCNYCHFLLESDVKYNGGYTEMLLPITTLTPDTLMTYMNTVNESSANSPVVVGAVQACLSRNYFSDSYSGYYYSSTINVFNDDYTEVEYYIQDYAYLNSYEDELKRVDCYIDALEQIRNSCTEEITSLDRDGYTLVEYNINYGSYKGYGYVETSLIEELLSFELY